MDADKDLDVSPSRPTDVPDLAGSQPDGPEGGSNLAGGEGTAALGCSEAVASRMGSTPVAPLFGNQSQAHLPSLPPTSSLPTAPLQQTGQAENVGEPLWDTGFGQIPFAPQPLAVKPTYKRRAVMPSARADGIIRKSGPLAAMEKQMWEKQDAENRVRSSVNIYDRPISTPEPVSAQRQRRPPKVRPAKVKAMKVKAPRPPPTVKPRKPPTIWRPVAEQGPVEADIALQSAKWVKYHGLLQPVNRDEAIEALVKSQQLHKQRLVQLAARPLPLQDLQSLIEVELNEEASALKELGITLHREFLKLQLEEGVLLNMLELSRGGTLDIADLELLRPRSKWTQSELRVMANSMRVRRGPEGWGRAESWPHDPHSNASTYTRKGDEGVTEIAMENFRFNAPGDSMDFEEEQNLYRDWGRDRTQEAENRGSEDGDEEEERDAGSSRLHHRLHGESYSSRPIGSSGQSQAEASMGRPGASLPRPYNSLDEFRKLVIEKSKKATLEDMADSRDDDAMEDEDMYVLEYDAESLGTYVDRDEEGNLDNNDVMDLSSEEDIGDVEDDDDNDDNDDDDDDDEERDEYDTESQEEDGDEDEEDEETAREALQRMLSQYGADPE